MKQRNERNVPVNVAKEVQTDINLIHQPVTFALEQYQGLVLTSPEIQGLIRAETDSQLLSFFREEASFFKGLGRVENLAEDELRKRLVWIQSQIDGLEKRDVTINGKSYYNILGDLQAELDRQMIINNNYQPKLRKANEDIADLEARINALTKERVHFQNLKVENDTLKEAFVRISDVVRNPQRIREIEKTVNDTLIPLLDEYEVKFDAMQKSIASIGRASSDPKSRLKAHLNTFLRNIERIARGTEEITLNGLESHLRTFLNDLEISQTYDQYQRSKIYKHQAQDLQSKLTNSVHIFRADLEKQIKQNPSLRGLIDLRVFDRILSEEIEVQNYNGVVVIEDVRWGRRRVEEYPEASVQTAQFLKLVVSQLKTILSKFPHIRTVLREEVVDIISQEVFSDAISIHEIERIFEVIKYKTEVVRVDNVYTYNNEAQLKVILHLKAMIKALLQELGKVKAKTGIVLDIDEGLLAMIQSELLDFINPDDVIGLFRSLPKIIEVDRIVEKDLTRYSGMLTEAHGIEVQHAVYADRVIEKPVTLKQEVAIVIEKHVPIDVVKQKPISFQQQVLVEVPTIKEVLVDRIVSTEHVVEVEVTSQVPIVQTEVVYVDREQLKEIEIEVPVQMIDQVPVVTTNIEKEIQIIDRFQERLVEVVREVTNIREIKVVEQVPIDQIKYIEVERIVNNFINVPQIVEVIQQVPITITNTVDKPVDIIQTVERIVQVVNTEERLVEVPVERTIPVIQEVPTPYREVETVFVKGDVEEVIREIERVVEKPIIRQVLQVRQVHVEKAVPLWVREQKPVIIQLKTPIIQNQVEIVTCEKERIVPFREEVQLQVIREVPVPIVCEKEIIRPVRVIVEKIVERMVEVPRVVEVERIVEKIVVVPRIVESIVHVPQIVEKIVEREVQILRIIELPVDVPTYLLREVQQIVPEVVERPIQVISYQPIEIERPIYLTTETQVIREVNVKEEVVVEVIREIEVPVIREKIVDRLLTVRDIEIKEKQVIIPFKHQVPIEVIQERAVEIKKIIENIVQVPQIIQRDRVLYEVRTEVQIVEVMVEKPVDKIEKVVYTDVHNHIQYQPQIVNLTKEIVAIQTEKIDVIKPEPYIVERIVVQNNIHQEAVPVYLEKAIPCKREVPVAVEVPVPVPVIREVPRDLIKERVVEVRTFIQNNREIPVQVQKIVQIDNIKPEIVEITQEILRVVVEHQQQEVVQQVAVVEERNNYIEVPSKPIIVQEYREIYRDMTEPLLLEKVVERVTILPQIVEVLKHIHEINETNISGIGLGVADLGIDVQIHTADYISLCTDLRTKLEAMLVTLRSSRLPEAKENTVAIEQLIVMLRSLATFPNIVQIPRYIDKIVEKPVIVPSKDTETINREIAATTLIEKLVEELKRIQRTSAVKLELDSEISEIFFHELKSIGRMDDKLKQFSNVVFNRFRALGNWTDEHSLMLNNFLQERFLMAGIVKESNDKINLLKKEFQVSEADRTKLSDALTRLSIINVGLKNSLQDLISSLRASRGFSGDSGFQSIISRAQQTLSQFQGNAMRQSRFKNAAQDSEKLAKELKELEKELSSFRGGESNRNSILTSQSLGLRREIDELTFENRRLKQLLEERKSELEYKDTVSYTREIDSLNRSNLTQRDQFERTLKRVHEDYQRQISSFTRDPRIITSTITDRSPEEQRLRGVQRNLQEKIVSLSREMTDQVNTNTQAKLTITRLQTENNDLKRRLEEALSRSLQVTSSTPGIQEQRWRNEEQRLRSSYDQINNQLHQNVVELNKSRKEYEVAKIEIRGLSEQLLAAREDGERMKKLFESKTSADREQQRFQYGEEQDKMRSPENRPSERRGYNTPAAQLRMTSPDAGEIQEESYSETSSSQVRGLSQSQTYRPTKTVTLRQLINERVEEGKSAKIIYILCERIQQEIREGRRYLYTPQNIIIENYNPDALDEIRIVLRNPIDPRIPSPARKYLPIEVLKGEEVTEKSCIYNVAIIWDQLIHGDTFYYDEKAALEGVDYSVRNKKLNPIYKNALFEMSKKDPSKRIDFKDVKQRLSLQNYLRQDQGNQAQGR